MKKLLLLLSVILMGATVAGAQAITTLPITITNYCPGATLNVDFTVTGTYTTGNIFNAQLSDATGSFAAPIIIGSLTGTVSGSVPSTIPVGTATGVGYRIRVISTLPNVNGTDNGANISIGTQSSAGTITGPTSVCASSSGHVYTAAVATGATSYTWTLPPGWTGTSTTNTITVNAGATGGTISVLANGNCGSSTAQTLVVNTTSIPATPSAIVGNTPVCNGSTNAFSVTDVAGVVYAWTLPATWLGASSTSSINATAGPVPGVISVTASNTCGTSSPSTKTVGVTPSVTPTASISSTSSGTICGSTPVTYNAFVTNAGATPIYQWKSNGVNVGTPALTYTAGSTAAGDVITFELTSSATCALPATVVSNPITMSVAPGVIASVTPAIICRGGSVQLSATSVTNATYSWNGPGYSSTDQSPRIQTIFNSGYYSVVASSSFCTTKDSILITVNQLPDVSITKDVDTLKATAGFASYTWALNGVIIAGATTANYIPTQSGNYVVRATSAAGCTGASSIYSFRATGFSNIVNGHGASIYPSPAYNELHVKQDQINVAAATVYNNVGQVVLTNNQIARNQDTQLDLSALPAGVYVIMLRNPSNGEVVINTTFVKQ